MKEVLKKFLFGLFVVLVLQGSKVRNAAALEKQANEQAYFEERFLIGDYEVTETEYEMRRPRTTHHPTTDDYSQEDGNNKRPWWVPTWPHFRPKSDFFDRDCFGKNKPDCIKAGGYCQWFTFQDPACYDVRYLAVGTAPNQTGNVIPLHVKFFTFSFGVHLVEGTFQRFYYSMSVEDCAKKCMESALGFQDANTSARIRCLSFDFYPYEVPIMQPPYDETKDTGICTLNSETKDTARLRNEDQGFTNAEFFYKSHCTTRPFSALYGYYEVRDPRGGAIAGMLAYSGNPLLGLSTPWGGSRWGIFHPNKTGYLPPPKTQDIDCTPLVDDIPEALRFRGGFTPLNKDQHCPGVMTKSAAIELCRSLGADLCLNATDLGNMEGVKLGCGYDEYAQDLVWHQALTGPKKRFPRCCATYNQPFHPIEAADCSMYESANYRACFQYTRATDCVFHGGQVKRRNTQGFGQLLETFRNKCKIDNPFGSCKGMALTAWTSSTDCVWCPEPGSNPGGGNGKCRPGGHYGICPLATLQQRQTFGLQIRAACSNKTICDLTWDFPDLSEFILGKSKINRGNGTPTNKPPSRNPTIPGQPSSPPSAKPPTGQPNAPPVPTARRTVSPTNIPTIEPTSRPTSSVSCTSHKTLWLCVWGGCKWNIKGKVDSCVDMPPEGAVLACSVYNSPAQCETDLLNAGGCVWKSGPEGGICVRKKSLRP